MGDPTLRYKWEIYCDKWVGNWSQFGVDTEDNTEYPGYSSQNSWGVYVKPNELSFHALNSKQKTDNGKCGKTGCRLEFDFDGPRSQLEVSYNGQSVHAFTGVKSTKALYPSFTPYSKNIWTVRNLRV